MDYSEIVLQHFDAPQYAGDLPPGAGRTVHCSAGDVDEGVQVAFALRVVDRRIAEIRFRAYGCPHVIAACSLAAVRLRGAPVAALQAVSAAELAAALQAPPEKLGRLLRLEDALRKCRQAWENT